MTLFRDFVFGLAALSVIGAVAAPLHAQAVQEYGDENLLGTGTYSSDPKAGATEYGLAPGVITDSANYYGHGYPFAPVIGDFAGTDQIYVGTNQMSFHDGYSGYSGRINGPQVLTLDYSALVPAGQSIQTLTLGIASDDFQDAVFGQPFTASLNGVANADLSAKLNSLNETGPLEHYFTFGVDPSLLTSSGVLNLTINEGGDGGDGWAVDFLTVGVTTSGAAPVPESSAAISFGLLLGLGLGGAAWRSRRRQAA